MTLVFLHGFLGAATDFASVAEHLPPQVETQSLSLPGHHRSRPVEADLDFESVADRLLDQVAARAIHLVGYSLGARLALAMCLRHPSRIEKVTLIGVNPGLETEAERSERAQSDQAWAGLLETHGLAAFLVEWYRQPLLSSSRSRPDRRHHDPLELARAMRQLGLARMPSYWPELSRLELPVELIVGEDDEKFSTIAERMLREIRNARLTRIPGAGHNVLLDQPKALAFHLMRHTSP